MRICIALWTSKTPQRGYFGAYITLGAMRLLVAVLRGGFNFNLLVYPLDSITHTKEVV